jgi:hypothetical protein
MMKGAGSPLRMVFLSRKAIITARTMPSRYMDQTTPLACVEVQKAPATRT